jgi:hypothetical protein
MKPITQYAYFLSNEDFVRFQKNNKEVEIINVQDASLSTKYRTVLVTYIDLGEDKC